jgi:hypothetical protein
MLSNQDEDYKKEKGGNVIMTEAIKALWYSPPGHGKTTLLGTAVGDKRVSPMLLLEFEAGTRSIESKIRKIKLEELGAKKPTIDKIDVVSIQTWADFDIAYDFLLEGNHDYKSVGLDSLSEINWLNMSEALRIAMTEDRKHDPDIPEQRDYLRSAGQIRKLVRFFRNLPLHVFFTSNAQWLQDPQTRDNKLWPSLTGKLAFEIPGLVEIVGYLAIVDEEDDKTSRWLFVQPTGRFEAKDRTEGGKLGEYIVEPTIPKIFDLIEGKEVKENDNVQS